LSSTQAFAKATYARLFSWIVARVNGSLREQLGGAGKGKGLLIGVLDIFGFEYFEVNSLEQLCINYCNEKLQFFFNDYVFNKEADEYVREGVDLELVEFVNNGPTLALLEAKRTGVFAMVDEEIAVPRGSDASLLSKLKKQHGADASYEVPSPKVPRAGSSFGVRHYAATVRYVVDGFLEKNRDALLDALVALGASSSNAVARALYADAAAASSARKAPARKKKRSLCGKFRAQLDDLVAALAGCAPHFVRCIKPNAEKRPDLFTSAMVQGQMRCAGVLEVCKIRRAGFAYRVSFDAFARRYGCVSGKKGAAAADLVAAFATPDASGAALLAARSYALGRTKVFLRAESRSALEDARAAALERFYVRVQSAGRRRVAAVQYARYAAIRAALREAVAARDVERVDAALGAQDYALLPYGGEHLPELREARHLAEAFANVKAKLVALKAARDARSLPKILEALEATRVEAPSPVVGDAVAEAEELVAVLEREPELEARLRDAAAAARRAAAGTANHADAERALEAAVGEAEVFNETRGGRVPLAAVDDARDALAAARLADGAHDALAAAITSRDGDALVAALARAQGLDREPLVDEARALLRELGSAREAAARLEGALSIAEARAAKGCEIPNFKGSYLGRFPLVLADFWTSDHLSERSRSVDAFSRTRARGTLTLKRR